MKYVTEDKFNKFILTDTIPHEIIEQIRKHSIYLSKNKVHRWLSLIHISVFIHKLDNVSGIDTVQY